MAQPLQIPILYTGKNFAVPDFKSMGNNIRESFRRIKEDSIRQKQYEDAKAERMRMQFLRELDADQVSFANEQANEVSAKLYSDAQKTATDVVQSKQGNISFEDVMNVRNTMNKYQQEMSKYKNSEELRLKDLATATSKDNINKFDPNKLKEIANWDYSTKGMYTGESLNDAYRTTTEDEWVSKDKLDLKNADYVGSYLGENAYGDDKKFQYEYMTRFYNPSDREGQFDLNEQEAVNFIANKYALPNRQQDDISLKRSFDNQVSDQEKELYVKKFGEDKAAYGWYTLKNQDELFPIARKEVPYTKSDTPKSFSINFGGKKITDNLTNSTSVEYGDVALDNFYPVGEVKVKLGKSQPIKGARVEQEDGSLGESEDIKVNNAEVVGVNMKDGFVESVVYSAPSTQYVYKIGSGANSMSADTLDELAIMTGASVEDLEKIAKKTKESGKPMTIVAPAYGNESTFQKSFAVDGSVGKTRKPVEKNYTIKGTSYSLDELKDMGYSEEQVEVYKVK